MKGIETRKEADEKVRQLKSEVEYREIAWPNGGGRKSRSKKR
jgi:hypothetical protein